MFDQISALYYFYSMCAVVFTTAHKPNPSNIVKEVDIVVKGVYSTTIIPAARIGVLIVSYSFIIYLCCWAGL
jgi:hypothetical protein